MNKAGLFFLFQCFTNNNLFLLLVSCAHPFGLSIRFSPLPISAISGTGTGELLDLVCSELKAIEVHYFS